MLKPILGCQFDAWKKAEPSCRICSSVRLCWEMTDLKRTVVSALVTDQLIDVWFARIFNTKGKVLHKVAICARPCKPTN